MKVKYGCGRYCITVDVMEGSKQARYSRKGRQAVYHNGNGRKEWPFSRECKILIRKNYLNKKRWFIQNGNLYPRNASTAGCKSDTIFSSTDTYVHFYLPVIIKDGCVERASHCVRWWAKDIICRRRCGEEVPGGAYLQRGLGLCSCL